MLERSMEGTKGMAITMFFGANDTNLPKHSHAL
jgi:hypothetical protein